MRSWLTVNWLRPRGSHRRLANDENEKDGQLQRQKYHVDLQQMVALLVQAIPCKNLDASAMLLIVAVGESECLNKRKQ